MTRTEEQYRAELEKCRSLFAKKMHDYGTAWRILRTTSITDQIYIKAKRISTLEQVEQSKVNEGIEPEFVGIVNYAIMGLIQLEHGPAEEPHMDETVVLSWYDKWAENTLGLMLDKNHDYGEAWREMRVSSLTDLILMKLMRTKQIEELKGETLVSEGIDANYQDMMNYAIFALIKLHE